MAKKQPSKTTREQSYADGVDLEEWWEEYANATKPNGTAKYQTVWQFVSAKTKIKWQRDVLWWMLGPKAEGEKYGIAQLDWEEKRERGFWFSTRNVEAMKTELRRSASAYESVKKMGEVNIEVVSQLKEMMRQLLREYGGKMFLPDLSAKENAMRARLLLELTREIQSQMERAQAMYGKTQGLDITALSQMFQLFGSQIGAVAGKLGFGAVAGERESGSDTMKLLLDMVSRKAVAMDMDLPDPDMGKIIVDAEAEKPLPKKKVN